MLKNKKFATVYLLLVLIALPFTFKTMQKKTNLTSKAYDQSTCYVKGMNRRFYYGPSNPPSLLPVGSWVEIFNTKGDRAGCFVVHTEGKYGMTNVYSSIWDDALGQYKNILNVSDILVFKVNGLTVNTDPAIVHWQSTNEYQYITLIQPPVTPTPTPTPSPIPTSVPTPIPTPTPDPTNNFPKITTNNLRNGDTTQPFKTFIIGEDVDTTDTLNMYIINLPGGIRKTGCTTSVKNKKLIITCELSGQPYISGEYEIFALLADNHRGYDVKQFYIKIN